MVCVRDENSWNIEPKDTKNIYFLIRKVLKHWTKWNKKSIFNLFLSWEHFNSFCIEYVTWQNLILSYMRSLLLYIYIYIYILMLEVPFLLKITAWILVFLAEPPKRTSNFFKICFTNLVWSQKRANSMEVKPIQINENY